MIKIMNRHTRLAVIFSVFFPLLLGLLSLDVLFWNKTFYSYLLSNILYESVFLFLFILSYIIAPIFLLIGFYSEYIGSIKLRGIIPFVINVFCYALGILFLQFGVKDFLLRPYLIILIHPAVYIIGISLIAILKKEKK